MLILPPAPPPAQTAHGPLSPLNAAWVGAPRHTMALPRHGHLMLLLALDEAEVIASEAAVPAGHYVWLAPSAHPLILQPAPARPGRVLALWISPPFVAEMARFLGIPDEVRHLLDGLPLPQGDEVSSVAQALAAHCRRGPAGDRAEDHFLEVVGEVLRLMRLRHEALRRLARHRARTLADLVPRLMRARQFLEAELARPLRTREVAARVGLSEFHFARLFAAAFGVTVRQHLIHLRLTAARRWLEQPGMTVTEAALAVGYGSLSAFVTAFARRFGLSPGQYQARAKRAGFRKPSTR